MATYAQVARILQDALGKEEGLLVMEFLSERLPPEDVARCQDVKQSEAALRLEIERLRADTVSEIEKIRADMASEIERTRAEAAVGIEKLRTELSGKIEAVRLEVEKVRAELAVRVEEAKTSQTRWAFVFWITQMVALLTILYQVLSS